MTVREDRFNDVRQFTDECASPDTPVNPGSLAPMAGR